MKKIQTRVTAYVTDQYRVDKRKLILYKYTTTDDDTMSRSFSSSEKITIQKQDK